MSRLRLVVAASTCALVAGLVVGTKLWVSRQPAAVRAATPPAAPVSLAGRWEMKIQKKKGGTQTWTLSLEQEGEALAGVIRSEGGDLPVKGDVKGRSIYLAAKRSGVTVEFSASLYDDTMVGTMRAVVVERRWTAKRL